MNVSVLRNGVQVYSREQAFGGFLLDPGHHAAFRHVPRGGRGRQAQQLAARNYESDLLRPFMDALALEVSRALQFFFTSTQFNQVDHIVLAGGCASSRVWPRRSPGAPRWIP